MVKYRPGPSERDFETFEGGQHLPLFVEGLSVLTFGLFLLRWLVSVLLPVPQPPQRCETPLVFVPFVSVIVVVRGECVDVRKDSTFNVGKVSGRGAERESRSPPKGVTCFLLSKFSLSLTRFQCVVHTVSDLLPGPRPDGKGSTRRGCRADRVRGNVLRPGRVESTCTKVLV